MKYVRQYQHLLAAIILSVSVVLPLSCGGTNSKARNTIFRSGAGSPDVVLNHINVKYGDHYFDSTSGVLYCYANDDTWHSLYQIAAETPNKAEPTSLGQVGVMQGILRGTNDENTNYDDVYIENLELDENLLDECDFLRFTIGGVVATTGAGHSTGYLHVRVNGSSMDVVRHLGGGGSNSGTTASMNGIVDIAKEELGDMQSSDTLFVRMTHAHPGLTFVEGAPYFVVMDYMKNGTSPVGTFGQ